MGLDNVNIQISEQCTIHFSVLSADILCIKYKSHGLAQCIARLTFLLRCDHEYPFFNAVCCTHFSHLLSCESNTLEYALLFSMRTSQTQLLSPQDIYLSLTVTSGIWISHFHYIKVVFHFLQHIPNHWKTVHVNCKSTTWVYSKYSPLLSLFFHLRASHRSTQKFSFIACSSVWMANTSFGGIYRDLFLK